MTALLEAKLIDLVLDLHDQYGGAAPKPAGALVHFTVVANRTTYQKALAGIEALLDIYGLQATDMSIVPGPEVVEKYNRQIKFSIARSTLVMGQI